ncbi:MAG TPA: hypothetical protein VHV47_07635 [Opitutaceae bacterium]|nr:hypothetical protein [Opitutaceae bacterium]
MKRADRSPSRRFSPGELLRLVALAAAALYLVHPYLTASFAGGTDARWYSTMLREFLDQERAGHFPVLMGQGTWDWNGGIHPFRSAPMFCLVAGLWDLLTFRTLGVFTLQHLAAATSALAGALGFYAAAASFLPRRRWEAMLLALLYVAAPVWLSVLYSSEAYMTFMALGVLPLVLYGNARALLSSGGRGFGPLAAGLALLWLCHPPVALTASLASTFLQAGRLLFGAWEPARLRGAVGCVLLFATLGAFYFAAMSELPSVAGSPRKDMVQLAGLFLALAGIGRGILRREGWIWLGCGLSGALLLAATSIPWLVWMILAAALIAAAAEILLRGGGIAPARRAGVIAFPCLLLAAGLADAFLGSRPEADNFLLYGLHANAAHAPGYFLPVSAQFPDSDCQPGLALWFGLLLLGAGFFRARSAATQLFAAAAMLPLFGFVPVPWIAHFFVAYLPQTLANIASFPMLLRLMPVMVGLMAMGLVVRLAAEPLGPLGRWGALLWLLPGAAWALFQTGPLLARGHGNVASAEYSRDILRSENVISPHFDYDLVPMPSYFWEGVVDPRLEFRLRDEAGRVYLGPDDVAKRMEAAGTTEYRPKAYRSPGEGEEWLEFAPDLTVQPGEHLLLRFRFDPSRQPAGWLLFQGKHSYREYHLPYAGLSGGFGIGRENMHVISLWNSSSEPETYRLRLSRVPGDGLSLGSVLADIAISHYDAARSPVRVLSFDPLRVEVDAPRSGWLETPRVLLPGYAARLDGQRAPVELSAEKLAMIRIPAGRHTIELSRHLTPRLWLAGIVSLLAWAFWLGRLVRSGRGRTAAALPEQEAEAPAEPAFAAGGLLHRLVLGAALVLAAAAVFAFYGWTIATSGGSFEPDSVHGQYYPELARGFRAGHLYMDAPVDPALLALPEKDRPGNAPYLLDTSLHQGHYYLYFGVAPVALLFLPYLLATGHSLPEPAAALVFAALALGFATAWWLGLRRRFFPQLGAGWTAAGVLALGICTAVPSALRRPMFYEVAILAGYAFTLIALWAITEAQFRPSRRGRWMAWAGVAAGLAFGSRANLAPAELLLLAAGCLGMAWREVPALRRRALLVSARAAALGFGAVAVGLAGYNFARFGSPFEFGHRYQLGLNPARMFHSTNFGYNLDIYYLLPPALGHYFPFVAPALAPAPPADYIGREHVHGEWIWLPLVLLALAAAAAMWRRRPAGWSRILALPALLFAVNLLIVAAAGSRANRYLLDFHPALVLTTLGALGPLLASRRGWAALARPLVAAGLAVALAFNLLASIQAQGFFALVEPAAFARLAGEANRLAWPWQRGDASAIGDRQVRVRWSRRDAQQGALFQPLLVSGTAAFEDVLWVGFGPGGRARFAYQHGDYGLEIGNWFPVEPGGESTLRISGAFLLPPLGHPWYGSFSSDESELLKNHLRITVDGTTRFDRAAPSFDSSPNLQRWGAWRAPDTRGESHFAGELGPAEALPPEPEPLKAALSAEGAIRLRLVLPRDRPGGAEALLQSGAPGLFDTVAVQYASPTTVRVIHDSLGAGVVASDPIPVDYGRPQELEIEAPFAYDGVSWAEENPASNAAPPARLTVRWNGRQVLVSPHRPHPADPGEIAIGAAIRQCSGVSMLFGGELAISPRREPLGPVGLGTLEFRPAGENPFADDHGVLARLERGDGESAALIWRHGAGGLQFGWADAGPARWSPPMKQDAAAAGVSLTVSSSRSIRDVTADVLDEDEIELRIGGASLLSAATDLFSQGGVRADVLQPDRWSGSGQSGAAARPEFVNLPPELPGRIRIRFRLPSAFAGGQPLLEAGRQAKADSLFLRHLPDGNYQLAMDHWGVGEHASEPLALTVGQTHMLVVEMGSLFAGGSFPRDRVRLTLDGKVVLDFRADLYPVQPGEVWIGRNPLGMSTSDTVFRGALISVRTRQPEQGP